jgi:hypothetical protein
MAEMSHNYLLALRSSTTKGFEGSGLHSVKHSRGTPNTAFARNPSSIVAII